MVPARPFYVASFGSNHCIDSNRSDHSISEVRARRMVVLPTPSSVAIWL